MLGISRVLIPPAPGVLCADGLLAADLKAEFSRTLPKAGPIRIGPVLAIFDELAGQADAWLGAEGVSPADRAQSRVALMRYHGQGGEVSVAWGETREAAAAEAAFAAAHEALYGFAWMRRSSWSRCGSRRWAECRRRAALLARQRGQADRAPHGAFAGGAETCRCTNGRISVRATGSAGPR